MSYSAGMVILLVKLFFCNLFWQKTSEWQLLNLCSSSSQAGPVLSHSCLYPSYTAIFRASKAASRGALQKKLFLKVSQYSLENICFGVSFNNRLQHRCFPVNIGKFSRTSVFRNICKWLLLKLISVACFQLTLSCVMLNNGQT